MPQSLYVMLKRGLDHRRRMAKPVYVPPPPILESLSPDTVISGDPDVVLSCIGSGFTWETTIKFGDYDEPTTLVSPTEVTTIVKPSIFAPAVVPVLVRNGLVSSDPLDFTFTAGNAQRGRSSVAESVARD